MNADLAHQQGFLIGPTLFEVFRSLHRYGRGILDRNRGARLDDRHLAAAGRGEEARRDRLRQIDEVEQKKRDAAAKAAAAEAAASEAEATEAAGEEAAEAEAGAEETEKEGE